MRSKNKRYQKNRLFLTLAWFILLFLISMLLSRYILIGINDMLAVNKNFNTVIIDIPENTSLSNVAEILKQNNIIAEKEFFMLYATATKASNKFSPGSYELESNMDYQTLINHLKNQSNSKNIAEITFTEGMSILEYAQLLEKNRVCTKNEFLKCCSSNQFDNEYEFIKSIDNSNTRLYKLEGYLFPDTYKFYQNQKPEAVIKKLLNNFSKKITTASTIKGYNEKVNIQELAKSKDISVDQLMNIASLIQAEAANVNDMYKVSSVIQNRLRTLNNGGKNKFGEFSLGILRIDATIYYPYKTKAHVPKNIINTFKSNYDTYKIEGLPPGPICNPGIDAILAALNPADTQYYYYCHSESGEAFYAKTNSEHMNNLKKAGLNHT